MVDVAELVQIRATLQSDGEWVTVRHVYLVQGPRGAVHWVYGDWGPRALDSDKGIDTEFVIRFGHPLYPMGFDVGYHSPVPLFDYQHVNEPVDDHCPWIEGPCWGDGSAVRASDFLTTWIQHDRDDDVIWHLLEAAYLGYFHEEE